MTMPALKRISSRFSYRTFTSTFIALVIMGLAISIPLLGITGWIYRGDMMKHIIELHEQTVMSLARENASEFTAMTAPLQSIVDLTAGSMNPEALERAVNFISSSSQSVHDIRVIDENGNIVAASDPDNRTDDFSRFNNFADLRAGKQYKSGIIITNDLKYMVELAWPVIRAHQYVGFVFARVDFSRLWSALDQLRTGQDSNVILVDRASNRVMADQSRVKLGNVYTSAPPPASKKRGKEKATGGLELITWEDKGQVISRYQIKDWPVDVVMESKMATLSAHMVANLRFMLMIALIWIAVGFVVSFFMATRITAPLENLARLMADIPGNMTLRAQDQGGEFTLISKSLNSMLDNIQQQEKKLQEQSAVAAVGRMASAMAHDVRGGMHNIVNAAALFDTKPDFARHIIDQSVQKMCVMLDDVLEFARSGTPDLAPVPIEALFAGFDPGWILHERFKGRRIEVIPGEPGITVMVDQMKMMRVFNNLARNSLEAGAKNVTLTWRKNGRSTILVVRDDGPGIPVELREKIFSPFFTTKNSGFGIGMSIVEMVVKSHRGSLELTDAEGGGAEFRILLPLVGEAANHQR